MRYTGSKEFPRESTRRSRYDFLLDAVDRGVVLLVRGEDFESDIRQESLRSHLFAWARKQGLEIETRTCWRDPETNRESEYADRGEALPFGMYVSIRSASQKGGRSSSGRSRR